MPKNAVWWRPLPSTQRKICFSPVLGHPSLTLVGVCHHLVVFLRIRSQRNISLQGLRLKPIWQKKASPGRGPEGSETPRGRSFMAPASEGALRLPVLGASPWGQPWFRYTLECSVTLSKLLDFPHCQLSTEKEDRFGN